MEPATFPTGEVFDDDYLYFYDTFLTGEQTQADADCIVELLGLRAGMRVLDLACGYGRTANALASRGVEVVGLDENERFLERARREAPGDKAPVEYVRGDMRSLPWRDEFDAVVCWFTSFGYFTDAGNFAVLTEAFRALRRGGRLLIDTQNRDWFERAGFTGVAGRSAPNTALTLESRRMMVIGRKPELSGDG